MTAVCAKAKIHHFVMVNGSRDMKKLEYKHQIKSKR